MSCFLGHGPPCEGPTLCGIPRCVVLCCVVLCCVVLCSKFSWVRPKFGRSPQLPPLRRTAQNLALFFFPLLPQFSFFLLSWGRFVEFWWCDRRPGPSNVHFWVLGPSCETPPAFGDPPRDPPQDSLHCFWVVVCVVCAPPDSAACCCFSCCLCSCGGLLVPLFLLLLVLVAAFGPTTVNLPPSHLCSG